MSATTGPIPRSEPLIREFCFEVKERDDAFRLGNHEPPRLCFPFGTPEISSCNFLVGLNGRFFL